MATPVNGLSKNVTQIPNLSYYGTFHDLPSEGYMVFLEETMEDDEVKVRRFCKRTMKTAFPFSLASTADPAAAAAESASKTMCVELPDDKVCLLNRQPGASAYVIQLPLEDVDDMTVMPLPFMTLDTVLETEGESAEKWEGYIRTYTKESRAQCRAFSAMMQDMSARREPEHKFQFGACMRALNHEVVRSLRDGMEFGINFRSAASRAMWRDSKPSGASPFASPFASTTAAPAKPKAHITEVQEALYAGMGLTPKQIQELKENGVPKGKVVVGTSVGRVVYADDAATKAFAKSVMQ